MINSLIAAGRLGTDLDVRYFESGAVIASASFAVSRIGRDAPTDWTTLKFIGTQGNTKLVDLAVNSIRKGSQIIVNGGLSIEQWNDKATGEQRQKSVILAKGFSYADAREGEKSIQIKGVNQLILSAALASAVDLRRSKEKQLPIASFKASLPLRDDVALIDCVYFGQKAEEFAHSASPGELLILQGELRVNKDESSRLSSTQILVNSATAVSSLASKERLVPPPATKAVPDYSVSDEPDYDDIPF